MTKWQNKRDSAQGSKEADEIKRAIEDRQFRPWHAGAMLELADAGIERREAAERIVELVASGKARGTGTAN